MHLDFPSLCYPKLSLTRAPNNPVLAIFSLKSGWNSRLRKTYVNKKLSREDGGAWIFFNS